MKLTLCFVVAVLQTPVILGCISDSVRIVGGSSFSEGRVEVYYEGQWGTVCDDQWDDTDAGVVCRALKLGNTGTARAGGWFGQGSGKIILDNVQCVGTETDLFSCPKNRPLDHDCTHSEDAGVQCNINECNSDPCQNGGNCVDEWNRYRCECLAGFTGTNCETDTDECGSSPCLNGATCVDQINRYICQCAIGYQGITCGESNVIQDAPALGLESGAIPDSSLTASSEYDSNHGPQRGRLNTVLEGNLRGAWNAGYHHLDLNQWIQVDLLCKYNIIGVATQGRQDYDQWVTRFKMSCSMDGLTFHTVRDPFNPYTSKIFSGNSDRNTIVYNRLPVPLLCRYVRILPYTWHGWISLRMELYGTLGASVRLVGGSSNNEGRVEVFYHGQWGTVCDDLWDDTDAGVVCRTLGLGSTGTARARASFGQGFGKIILDNVQCVGTETDLFSCPKNRPLDHDCTHSEDAGVQCN